MTNERDEFRTLLDDYAKRLDASQKLNTLLLARGNLGRSETALRSLLLKRGLEIALNAVALVLLGSFVADSIGDWRFAVPGAVLFAFVWIVLMAEIRQVVALKKIEFDDSVVSVQSAIERLRVEGVQMAFWFVAALPLLWVPVMIVGLRVLGVNAYAFGPLYLFANIGLGVAVLVAALLVARRVSPAALPFADLLAGRALTTALTHLDAVRRFAEGEPTP